MYSPEVIDKNLWQLQKEKGLALRCYSVADSKARTADLSKAWDSGKAQLSRELKPHELRFITNEVLLSSKDFRYWAERYGYLKLDGGGLDTFTLWGSQRYILSQIVRREAEMHREITAGHPTQGLRIVVHKARQLGTTAFSRLLLGHRSLFSRNMGGMSASVDDDKIQELYDRDKIILDNLPWWMKPSISYDVKGEHIHFDKLNIRLLYQQSRQQSGLGQGRQFELSHLTECAFWPYPQMISLDFFPTIPLSPNTLSILESTANGRGNWWHEFTEDTRKGQHPEWTYIFLPWYTKDKYRLHPPDTWKPAEITHLHEAKVLESSRQLVGEQIRLDREQLFWYEVNRESARKGGDLNIFLTNFCATPEESFQHSTKAAVSPEIMERLRLQTKNPIAYEVQVA